VIEWNVAKVVVVVLLAAAVLSLGLGLGHLMKSRDGDQDKRQVYRSLVKRVAFSVAAMVFILIAGFSGWLNQ